MRISDWSSDVCSSDLVFGMPFYAGWGLTNDRQDIPRRQRQLSVEELFHAACIRNSIYINPETSQIVEMEEALDWMLDKLECAETLGPISERSEEHTSELQSLMRISYDGFGLKK